jgi:hypothetical protein
MIYFIYSIFCQDYAIEIPVVKKIFLEGKSCAPLQNTQVQDIEKDRAK